MKAHKKRMFMAKRLRSQPKKKPVCGATSGRPNRKGK